MDTRKKRALVAGIAICAIDAGIFSENTEKLFTRPIGAEQEMLKRFPVSSSSNFQQGYSLGEAVALDPVATREPRTIMTVTTSGAFLG